MSIMLNAKGTSVPFFKIGKTGATLYPGVDDPSLTYTMSPGDYWLGNSLSIWSEENSWAAPSLAEIKIVGSTISALPGNNVIIDPTLAGGNNLVLNGSTWPTSIGSANTVLTTDVVGNLSWAAVAASSLTGVLPITSGGTGQNNAVDALNALLPAQIFPSTVLMTDGANASWVALTAADVGADPTGTADGVLSAHNSALDPHAQYLLETEAALTYAQIEHAHSIHNIVKVCTEVHPGTFNTIESAITEALTKSPSASNRVIIEVQPGEYLENPFTVPAYVYVIGPDPWNSVHIKAVDNGVDFITVSPNGGMFQVAISGPTTSGFAAIKQVASGTTKLYWVNLRSFKIGVKLAPTSGAARCHCIAVVSDSSGSTSERMFSVDNPVGAGIFIMMQSGPMSVSLSGGYAVYLNGATANATMDLCQFRGTGATQLYVNNGATARGISCSFAQGTTAINVGPDGASRVDMHGSQIKPGMFTTDINIQSASAIVTYSGVATESKILNPLNASLIASISDSVKGQVILGEMWIGSKAVQTPLTSYIQADKNTGVIAGGNLSAGPGALQVTVAAGSGFVDLATGLKKVEWIETIVNVSANTATKVYVDSDSTVLLSPAPTEYVTVVLGEVVAGSTEIELVSESSIILPQFRQKLFDYLTHVVGPINTSGGAVTSSGLTIDVTDSTYYVTEEPRLTTGGTAISFRYWYKDGSGGWSTSTTTNLSPDLYDDGSGTLASVPTGKFKRDVLYVNSNSGGTEYHIFYGQDIFDTAETALNNPTIDSDVAEHACRLAGLVLQEGTTVVTLITDDRPRLGQMASATSTITSHNDLTDRDSAIAHTQYQLITEKNQANGYLGLNGSALIPASYFPLTDVPPTNVSGTAASAGISDEISRADHKHNILVAAPVTIASGNSEGAATTLSRSDHVHSHGNQTVATHHAIATTLANGFMSSADKILLDSRAASGANTDITSITGSAATLTTGRTVSVSGDATGTSPEFNGSSNLTIPVTLGTVAISKGGTGETSASAAINALLPVQTGKTDNYLRSNGTTASWVAPHPNSTVQVLEYGVSASSGTTTLPTTTPTIANGTIVSVMTITPTSASNNIALSGAVLLGTNGSGGAAIAVWRKIGAGAEVLIGGILTDGHNHNSNQRTQTTLAVAIDDIPATTGLVTYTLRAGAYNGAGTWYVAQPGLGNWGGAFSAASRITVTEHTPP